MKRFLAPILLVTILFPSFSLGLEMDDLVQREGLYYEKFTNIPFSGKIDEGLERGSFKDGKKDGPWVRYWNSGQLWEKGTFKDWVLDGPWVSYHEDGTVNEEYTGTYKDGVKVE